MVTRLLVLLTLFMSMVTALRFEVVAESKPQPVCIRDFVGANQLVVVNINTDGRAGDGQVLDVSITDSIGNKYSNRKNIVGSAKIAFTSHHSVAFDVCFTNRLEQKHSRSKLQRSIELEIESGAAARDWNSLQVSEKLKPVEVQLRKIQDLTAEIHLELQFLKRREERMRDTNESTNSRVKWFSIIIVGSLVGLGAWQILYLRHYFKVKHII